MEKLDTSDILTMVLNACPKQVLVDSNREDAAFGYEYWKKIAITGYERTSVRALSLTWSRTNMTLHTHIISKTHVNVMPHYIQLAITEATTN